MKRKHKRDMTPENPPEAPVQEPTQAFPAQEPEEGLSSGELARQFSAQEGAEETSSQEKPTREFPAQEAEAGDMGDTRPVDMERIHQQLRAAAEEETAPEGETGAGEQTPASAGEAGSADGDPAPFEPGWEPEYDEPIGEYVPPAPIVFRPRSRMNELKRKLVEGPEKRYYDLMEKGTGKLQVAIVLSLIITLLSGAALIAHSLGLIPENRMKLLVYSQVLALLLAALLGSFRMIDGVAELFHRRFTLDTVLAVMFLVCLADGILGLRDLRIPFCAAFCLETTMALWAEYERRSTEMGQMDTLRKATRLDSVVKVDELYQGRPGFLRGEGRVEDFMDQYQTPSGPEKLLSRYGIVALVVCLATGLAAGFLHGYAFGVHSAAAALLAAVPGSCLVTLTRPKAVLEKRLHRLGAVICGWRGVQGLCGAACVPVGDRDLFPGGAVKMNGVKFFGDRDPDQVVAYGTALIAAEGGGLTPVFDQLLDSRSGRHYAVQNLRSYGSGGLGGEVNGEPVLVGMLSFMREIGVDMPEGTRVNQAVYVAIDGELCGVFAITYIKVPSGAAGLTTLCGYRSLTPVLTSRDFVLTESFLRSKFAVNTRRIEFPDRATRYALSALEPDPQAPALALTTQEGLAPLAFAITGGRALRTASRLGAAVHLLAGILGVVMVALLAVLGSLELLSPTNLLLYELIWMVPGLLLTEWTRNI